MVKREKKKKSDELLICKIRNENFAFVKKIKNKNVYNEMYYYYNDTLHNDICLISNRQRRLFMHLSILTNNLIFILFFLSF